jgi:PAS domain S-box-containing protein
MRSSSRNEIPGQNYWLAVASVACCTILAGAVNSLSREVPFLFFFPAVLFSLWVGGFRVAVFSSLLSALAVDFFLLPPIFSFTLSLRDTLKEVLFVASMSAAAWIFDRRRIRAEGMIRFQDKLLAAAVESILITDAEHRVVSWNRGAERLYGWTEAEAIGKIPHEILQTSYPEPFEDVRRKLKETGRWQGRLHRICKDGHAVVTEASWALDRETGCILQTSLDVTAQSLAEDELQRVNRALSALSRVNQLLIHTPEEGKLLQQAVKIIAEVGAYPLAWVAIPEHDPKHSVSVRASAGKSVEYLSKINLTWNDEPLGHGPTGRALRDGKPCVNHSFLTDPDCAPWREFATQYGFVSSIGLPLIVQGKTFGALTLYATEMNAFKGEELALVSELAGDLAFALDAIQLRKQAEEERKLRLMLEDQLRQSQKMEAIGRLAGGIAHDFNNLLMVIMAQTELLSLQLHGPALAKTESVMKSARRAAELTHQLLAFSRKQIVQPKVLSMNPIIFEIAKMAGHLLGENIEIATALCKEPWLVKVDRSQFEQVIMNLIVNARDAMPSGGQLTLETANTNITTEYIKTHPLVPPGRYVMLAVSDTGAGMTEETKSKLFEPFFTTKEAGKGTGLGLSMVYGIVKQNNGFIWYYSEIGKGTCFKIYLPAADPHEPNNDSIALTEFPSTSHQATILLVEDERDLREVVTDFLLSGGHKVIAAESQDEAFERALEHGNSIDLLLTDVMLKKQNGKELAHFLRNKGFNFKVIYMSGYTPNAIVHHGVLDEATIFLQKPFTRSTLLSKVRETLDT